MASGGSSCCGASCLVLPPPQLADNIHTLEFVTLPAHGSGLDHAVLVHPVPHHLVRVQVAEVLPLRVLRAALEDHGFRPRARSLHAFASHVMQNTVNPTATH